MVNFGNRYTVLANLIRHLRRSLRQPKLNGSFADQTDPRQIAANKIIQSCSAIAFVFALAAMIAAYFDGSG